MTPRERAVLNAIKQAARNGRPCPSNLDLAVLLDCESMSTPVRTLQQLEAAYIEAVRALESCADPDNWTRHKDARPPAEADWGRCARDTLEKINADT